MIMLVTTALAMVCIGPELQDTAVLCGTGARATASVNIVEHVTPDEPWRVEIIATAGEPLEGVEVGATVELFPDRDDHPVPPDSGAAFLQFIGADSFVFGAAIVEETVTVGDGVTLSLRDALDIGAASDAVTCQEDVRIAAGLPLPERGASGQCNDTPNLFSGLGCGSSAMPLGVVLIALLRRGRGRCGRALS
ncbi:MAG: hypothetical protein Q8O67_23690 [Deltaproteobacteria bacterium]|nr:hypothetical protein [Deltaproteobacteria bacterium]